jgi:hypothetical protein
VAPPKKSGMPMGLVAAVAVIVIGGSAWAVMSMNKGETPTNPPAAGTGTQEASTSTQTQPANNGGGATQNNSAQPKSSGNPQNTGGRSTGTVPPANTGTPTTPVEDFDDKISAWKEWTDGSKPEATVSKAVTEINATLPRMAGVQKARAYFYLANAYGLQNREEAACEALKKGRDVPGTNEASITKMIADMQCK